MSRHVTLDRLDIEAGAGRAEWRPSPEDRAALRAQTKAWLIASTIVAVPMVVSLILALVFYARSAPLRDGRTRTVATVVGGARYKASDRLRIAFTTGSGQLVQASVPVSDITGRLIGSNVVVAYDPHHPSHARTLDDWDPPYTTALIAAVVLGLCIVPLLWRAWRWPRRLWKVATTLRARTTMVLRTVTVPGRAAVTDGALWDLGDPPSKSPRLAFRCALPERWTSGPFEVDVLGRATAGHVAVLVGPDGVLWPSTKLKRPRLALVGALAAQQPVAPAAPVPLPARTFGAAPDSGSGQTFGLPELRGNLPPLPAEVLQSPPKRRGPSVLKAVAVMVPACLVAGLPLALPTLLESRARNCPSTPAPRAGTEGVLTASALPALLPAALPGYAVTQQGGETTSSTTDYLAQVVFVETGMQAGYSRDFAGAAGNVSLGVFQFPTERAAAEYESERLLTLCSVRHKRLAAPASVGADAIAIPHPDGTASHRFAMLRGSRVYVVSNTAPTGAGDKALLGAVTALAR